MRNSQWEWGKKDGNEGVKKRISGWEFGMEMDSGFSGKDLIYRKDFGMGIPGGNLGMDLGMGMWDGNLGKGFWDRNLGWEWIWGKDWIYRRDFRMGIWDLGKGLEPQERLHIPGKCRDLGIFPSQRDPRFGSKAWEGPGMIPKKPGNDPKAPERSPKLPQFPISITENSQNSQFPFPGNSRLSHPREFPNFPPGKLTMIS